jgi:hypothetical protein
MSSSGKLPLILLCSLGLISSGCQSLHTVPLNASPPAVSAAGVKEGRKVVVTLKSGAVHEMHVTVFDATNLSGIETKGHKALTFAYADMQSLEVYRLNGGRTFLATTGGIVVAAGLLFLAAMSAVAASDD